MLARRGLVRQSLLAGVAGVELATINESSARKLGVGVLACKLNFVALLFHILVCKLYIYIYILPYILSRQALEQMTGRSRCKDIYIILKL